ncbi:peptidoglycan-binding protein [Candidatus Poribacteria bacterium]|nr:peptidoglycan-binding protein [Candidatus Poribacteria bacterium]
MKIIRNLKRDIEGEDVKRLQEELKALGYDPGPIDGKFGPRTEEAVKKFQKDKGLKEDGIVGPKTAEAINKEIFMKTNPITGRNMFIWKLKPVLTAEMGINNFVSKAKMAKLSSVWIKIAVGTSPYHQNLSEDFNSVRDKLMAEGITVWGWHEPRCKTVAIAENEAQIVADLAKDLKVKGILMDAEKPEGNSFFQGGVEEASAYAKTLRELLGASGLSLAICSHDIPHNFPGFPFEEFARYAHVNAPQVYYGGSPSVRNRLERAINANSMLTIPFVPVGAGWLGDGGGCASASACAERALVFMHLIREYGFPGYGFWHWGGAPSNLWEVLFSSPV